MGLGLLLALVLFSHLIIHFRYFREQEDDTISVEFFLWSFINYKIEIPVLTLQNKLSGISLTTRTELETGGDNSRELLGKAGKFSIESLEDAICKFKQWWPLVDEMKVIADYFLSHIRVTCLEWHTKIGTGDAAVTGFLTGFLYSFKGGIISAFYRKLANAGNPKISVEPNFRKEQFSTSINCIFKIRVGNIMVTGVKIFMKMVKRRGVNRTCQNIP
ncbi:hypothetical protein N752_22205 [Desulforamulus aquiferis]|nr:DUF2953 domain-containing protein [Desulforamulus aquiferis]RYD02901.1 hypothetical protein N752_22205 [Desulforamulus aquiferis]